jgi:hypothetical protein
MPHIDAQPEVEQLFKDAEGKGDLDYLFTLVRVDGMQFGHPDPLTILASSLSASPPSNSSEAKARYDALSADVEPLKLLSNLMSCAAGESYNINPLIRGSYPSTYKLTPQAFRQELAQRARTLGKPVLASLIESAYSQPQGEHDIPEAVGRVSAFLHSLLEAYSAERLRYAKAPRLVKLPRFEVLELLTNADVGLQGFKVHFSNDSWAEFRREVDSVHCINLRFGPPIGFMVGDLAEMKDEWRVAGKRLYEVGLPGRYNELGQWKPIIYPKGHDHLLAEARAVLADDDVRGALFYMLCTGHRVIEFVVHTTIDLPQTTIRVDSKEPINSLYLWKCDVDERTAIGQNFRLYDGWLEVTSIDPPFLKSAIAMIGIALNRLAFAYDGTLKWRTKYRLSEKVVSLATPSKDDLDLFDSLLIRFPSSADAAILEASLDWYNRGLAAANVFVRFLSYYIAIESVATAIAAGQASLGLHFPTETKEQAIARRIECIRDKAAAMLDAQPLEFVTEAYFDCVGSLRRQTEQTLKLVFGDNHDYVKAVFIKKDGHSLSSIRSGIAHGSLSLLSTEAEALVAGRVGELARIAKEFLKRLVFNLTPADGVPTWSREHRFSASSCDPRATLVANTEKPFPCKDWRIRPEWCE